MKKILYYFLLILGVPSLVSATSYSYDWRLINSLLIVSILDEIILFGIVPIFLIFLTIRIIKYSKLSPGDVLKEKRKGNIYKSILWIIISLVVGLLLSFSPTSSASTPCEFNMGKTCMINFSGVLNHFGILKSTSPASNSFNCPPGFIVKDQYCIPQ